MVQGLIVMLQMILRFEAVSRGSHLAKIHPVGGEMPTIGNILRVEGGSFESRTGQASSIEMRLGLPSVQVRHETHAEEDHANLGGVRVALCVCCRFCCCLLVLVVCGWYGFSPRV